MSRHWQVALVVALGVLAFGVAPFVFFRSVYEHDKRLRAVVPGRVYRSGQMTAGGFADAVARSRIRTVINVQEEYPDPDLAESFWGPDTVKESEVCRRLGVRYVALSPDLVPRRWEPGRRPGVIEPFLALMDDESTYPVLIHCKAGLHRTGVLVAVYRMEYQGWSNLEAFEELRDHGFGAWACTSANDYVRQYVLNYRRGVRRPPDPEFTPGPGGGPGGE
jgi:tyrosine-protein phosphatase SIW14